MQSRTSPIHEQLRRNTRSTSSYLRTRSDSRLADVVDEFYRILFTSAKQA